MMRPLQNVFLSFQKSLTKVNNVGNVVSDRFMVDNIVVGRRWIHSGQTMTSQEVATALRPFIFIVHPDRFWNHPKEKTTNEVSLKRLNEYLGNQLSSRTTSNEQIISFYMRNSEMANLPKTTTDICQKQIPLKRIDIKLNSRENINSTVQRILMQCSLPVDYLNKIGKQTFSKPPSSSTTKTAANSTDSSSSSSDPHYGHFDGHFYRKGNDYYYSKELYDEMEGDFSGHQTNRKVELNLTDWLKQNYSTALKKIEASRPIHTELNRIKEELIDQLKLVDLKWNCDWSVSHIRGCLKNLSVLSTQYPDDLKKLNGKTVLFSRYSGVGFDGQIMLSMEDVRNSWLDMIRSIKQRDPILSSLPVAENSLSELLHGMSIVHPPDNIWIAKIYLNQLKRFTRTIKEYQNVEGFPKQWPSSLSEYRLIVENEAGPLMLSTSGEFIVPASCPASLFVRFISENLQKASQTIRDHGSNIGEAKTVTDQCIVTFGLKCLDKDENITPEQMINFGQRLLTMKEHFRPYLKGTHLRVSMYYSVMHDGQICVPLNFIA